MVLELLMVPPESPSSFEVLLSALVIVLSLLLGLSVAVSLSGGSMSLANLGPSRQVSLTSPKGPLSPLTVYLILQ